MDMYLSKEGDTLDEICWRHYYFKRFDNQASQYQLAEDEDEELLLNTKYILAQQSPPDLTQVYLNTVILNNPQLLNYPLFLPAGIEIRLPNITEFDNKEDKKVVSLWD